MYQCISTCINASHVSHVPVSHVSVCISTCINISHVSMYLVSHISIYPTNQCINVSIYYHVSMYILFTIFYSSSSPGSRLCGDLDLFLFSLLSLFLSLSLLSLFLSFLLSLSLLSSSLELSLLLAPSPLSHPITSSLKADSRADSSEMSRKALRPSMIGRISDHVAVFVMPDVRRRRRIKRRLARSAFLARREMISWNMIGRWRVSTWTLWAATWAVSASNVSIGSFKARNDARTALVSLYSCSYDSAAASNKRSIKLGRF